MASDGSGLSIALPKGRFQSLAAHLVAPLDLGFSPDDTRDYRFVSNRVPGLSAKLLHEKDIPVQVALGHYALGLCGREWVEELRSKYASRDLAVLQDLNAGRGTLFVARSRFGDPSWEVLRARREHEGVRIASEFPNLAEAFALRQRLRRFRVFLLWGAVEAYPPESADLVLLAVKDEEALAAAGLAPVAPLLELSACVVAHQPSLVRRDLASLLELLLAHMSPSETGLPSRGIAEPERPPPQGFIPTDGAGNPSDVRLALPDGSLQGVVTAMLSRAGLLPDGYGPSLTTRRPVFPEGGVVVKVIRPQDMPLQVANGHFDVAVTGLDWLEEHRAQFPGSPVVALADLGHFGRGSQGQRPVRLVAVVHGDLPAATIAELRDLLRTWRRPLRIASEYVHLADLYARQHHLAPYRVIPTWGATEGFLPDDADLLIESTETGQTIARLNLRIIDELFLSSGRLIANESALQDALKGERVRVLAQRLSAAREGA